MLGSNSRSLKSWPEPPRTPAREPKDAVVPDGVEEEVAEELGEARGWPSKFPEHSLVGRLPPTGVLHKSWEPGKANVEAIMKSQHDIEHRFIQAPQSRARRIAARLLLMTSVASQVAFPPVFGHFEFRVAFMQRRWWVESFYLWLVSVAVKSWSKSCAFKSLHFIHSF